jgi:hypothetical protein
MPVKIVWAECSAGGAFAYVHYGTSEAENGKGELENGRCAARLASEHGGQFLCREFDITMAGA